MSELVTVWQPFSRGRLLPGMGVPFKGLVMRPEQYQSLLLARLTELIEADPKEAWELLTDSPEYNPDLFRIAKYDPQLDWPVQIMVCDQMMMFLGAIVWPRGSRVRLTANEMPKLDELVESLAV